MAAATQVDTLIFVDVDGVLNVGIHDGDQAPLLLNEDNRMYATSRGKHWRCSAEEKQCIQKVLAVVEKQLEDGNGETFASLTCDPGKQCSSVLVRRLAQIIASSGERRSVILASNWRKPKYASRVRRLEAEISRQLGKPFTFDARTRPAEETSAADRLQCIGDFVQSHFTGPAAAAAAGAAARVGPLRVLVLDDFFITPLDGWSCGGTEVCSTRDAEAYLRGRAPAAADVAVRLLHPYAEWAGPRGLQLQVGAGLSARHCGEALAFLGAAAEGAQRGGGVSALEVGAWLRDEQQKIRTELSHMREDTARLRAEASKEAEHHAALEQWLVAEQAATGRSSFVRLPVTQVTFSVSWNRVAYAGLAIASAMVIIFLVSFIFYRSFEGTSAGFLSCFGECNLAVLECLGGVLCGCSPRLRIVFWAWLLLWSVGLVFMWKKEILQPFLNQLIVFMMVALAIVAVLLLSILDLWLQMRGKLKDGAQVINLLSDKSDFVLGFLGMVRHDAQAEKAPADSAAPAS